MVLFPYKNMNRKKEFVYDKVNTGKRIRMLREQAGISRGKAAEDLDKAEKYYSDIERGACGMSLETALQIAAYFRVTVDYLVYGGDEPKQPELYEESKTILFWLEHSTEEQREKAQKLLKAFLLE